MNPNEPDKFEQFMADVRGVGASIGEGFQWLLLHVETVASVAGLTVLALVVLLVAGVRRRRRSPEVSGWRHAGRR